jgi:hypothetical protein
MNSKKLFYILCGFLVLLGLGMLLGIQQANTVLTARSKTLVDLKATDKATAVQKQQLVKDKQDIAKYQDLNTIAKTVVPQDKDQARAVREIVNLANQSGISKLSSIAFPASTLGGTKVKTPNGLTQVEPVKGVAGVYNLQITVTQANTDPIPYSNFIGFLSRLEQNRRTAQVSSITVQPDPKSPNMVSFTLVISEYIKP